jgi:hypothetical protein
MDVHIGREAVTSWKDFFVRYLLIVLGILSAWAVNQWNESRQHTRLAEQTRAALQEELGANLKELREAIAANEHEKGEGPALGTRLLQALKARRSEAEITREVIGDWQPALRLQLPSLRRDAWEAAIAGQALAHLRHDELRRFSAAYTAMRDVEQYSAVQISSQAGELVRGVTAWQLKRRLGQVDAMELTRLLLLWQIVAGGSLEQLKALEAPLTMALGVAPGISPGTAPGTATSNAPRAVPGAAPSGALQSPAASAAAR